MRINLNQLSVIEILKLSKHIKGKCFLFSCLEEVAQEFTKIFYESFTTDSGKNPFVLVRFFNTCSYHNLPEDIRAYIQSEEQKKKPLPEDRYLTLMGTYGDREEWRSRKDSKNYQAFFLSDPQFHAKFPMFSAVFRQIGIEILSGSQLDMSILIKERHKQLSAFCVENAVGSNLIPKQSEFVEPFAIQSVFGFGGIYPTGNVYIIAIFSREKINKETASLFLSLNPVVKQITLPYVIREKIFNEYLPSGKNSKEESLGNLERFNENVVDNHRKYLIEKEVSDAIRVELEIANEHMIELAKELEKSNKNLQKEIVKRSYTEDALLESKRQLQSVLDNTTACIYIKDISGKYLLINKQFEKLFHITREQIKGKTDYDIFPQEMAEAFQKNDKKVLEANMPMEMEEIAPHDDGPHTYISIKFPLFTSQGVPYGICGISTDISQRKQMEIALKKGNEILEQSVVERTRKLEEQNIQLVKEFEKRKKIELALKESEKRFRVMFEQAAVGVALHEVKTDKFVIGNKKYCDIVGYTIDEMKEKKPGQITHPEDLPVKSDNMQKLIDGRIHEFTMEKRYFHKNGSIVWVNMTASPMWKAGEAPDFYMVIVRDITERKKAIESLVESNERIQLLLDSTGEGIYGIDANGLCTFVNASCINLLGYENAKQLIGKDLHNTIHHSHRDGTPFPIGECKVFQAFKKGESIHVADDIIWRADGTFFPVEYTSYPIKKDGSSWKRVGRF
ncbi:MAG: PAS domain S-box protein [Planctomycetes bacterium]|nr:PAS domain S-box protein [Planctomycetota bacterium]